MKDTFNTLISTAWLAENLGTHLNSAEVCVLDASRHLPASGRDPAAEFAAGHIPGARFLDLGSLTDTSSNVPAALPRPDQVAARLSELGTAPGAQIVLYDDSAIKSSARAWFALTQCGVPNVAILDGGFAKWKAEGRALESGNAAIDAAAPSPVSQPSKVLTKAQMLANCEHQTVQVLDARAASRVFGAGIDPVHGGQNGRIPGSLNLPFDQVFEKDGTYKSPEVLQALFVSVGVDLDRSLVTSCGSGMTASVLIFASHLAGKTDTHLYDGSWQEWEADPETPKEQGPQ